MGSPSTSSSFVAPGLVFPTHESRETLQRSGTAHSETPYPIKKNEVILSQSYFSEGLIYRLVSPKNGMLYFVIIYQKSEEIGQLLFCI